MKRGGGGGRNGAGSRGLGWVVLGKSSPESEGMEREERRIRREGDSEGGPVRYNQQERETPRVWSQRHETRVGRFKPSPGGWLPQGPGVILLCHFV